MELTLIETREYGFEIREAEGNRLSGIAAPFNSLSSDMGGWFEKIAAGAFAESIRQKDHDIVALWSHDKAKPLASRDANSLELTEEESGLAFRMNLDVATTWIADALTAVKGKLVRTMSFGFLVPEGGDIWERTGGKVIRTVLEADLWEISPVAIPAYAATSINSRGIATGEAVSKFLADERSVLDAAKRTAQARFNFARAKHQTRRTV